MQTRIIKVRHPLLKLFIPSFLFFRSDGSNVVDYTTFPKSFLQTVRFRKVLTRLNPDEKLDLTNIAYLNNYYDQAHFTKEVKALAGATPAS